MALSLTYPSNSTKEWSRPRIVGDRKVCEIQISYTNAADVYVAGGMDLQPALQNLTGMGWIYCMTTQFLRVGADNAGTAGVAVEGGTLGAGTNYAARGVSVNWDPYFQKLVIASGGYDANLAGATAGEIDAGTILGHPLGQIFFCILQVEGK